VTKLLPIGIGLHLAALACVVIAYEKRNTVSIEGAYFNRSTGEPARTAVFWQHISGWLLAASILIAAAGVVFVLNARAQRRLG
jgi:uncharacterized membrane protein